MGQVLDLPSRQGGAQWCQPPASTDRPPNRPITVYNCYPNPPLSGLFLTSFFTSITRYIVAAARIIERMLTCFPENSNSFFLIPVFHFPWSEKAREARLVKEESARV